MDRSIASSFRDPSGFVYRHDGTVHRQVNRLHASEYDHLISSGLYRNLVNDDLLIPHEEVALGPTNSAAAYKAIEPEQVSFISYPYEWSFSQIKDAAMATLRIQRRAMDYGMALKDCSAYNIQFHNGKPILIDTLSFEKYQEGEPWGAYRQFCQHFLAPLALMSYKDVRLSQLLRVHIDGIPLDFTSGLLPWRTRLVLPLLLHIHLHARSQARNAGKSVKLQQGNRFNYQAFMGLVDGLESAVARLKWRPRLSGWADYYDGTHDYAPAATAHKRQLIGKVLEKLKSTTVWDLGSNTGLYSRIASGRGNKTISFDFDPACVELNYRAARANNETNILPLLLDLTNPTPGLGWENEEWMSLQERGPADVGLALALLHHLAISNNLPFAKIASFLNKICRTLVVEFVPKDDMQVQKLLANRKDIFDQYTELAFREGFSAYFRTTDRFEINNSKRVLYLMRRKG